MTPCHRRFRLARWAVLALVGSGLLAVPAGGVPKERPVIGNALSAHLSQVVTARFWAAHPEAAPPQVAERLAQAQERSAALQGGRGPSGRRFNDDVFGLPQNEESITACRERVSVVLGGTNDFRGLLDSEQNFTGWHFSTNGGRSLANEGLLPSADGLPSGGDPVDVAGTGCEFLYAGSLAYDPETVPFGANGIAAYRTTPGILATCPGGADPSCWPVRRLVAEGAPGHFLDKEWLHVGRQAGTEFVWLTYSDFVVDETSPIGFTSAEIFAVRCTADLASCTAPIPISEDDLDVQFSDVTIAEDGRAYITWSEIIGELPDDPDCPPEGCEGQTFVHKLRVETAPGSATFGPERVVFVEEKPIPFGGFLQANDFRVATYPKSEVASVGGHSRVLVVWDACKFRPLPTVCEDALIKLSWSDDEGATWTDPIVISKGGVNYFPTITNDRRHDRLSIAWFTNRFDQAFDNRQDVVLTSMRASNPGPSGLRRLTSPSNESEADPLLGGFFIGDYIEAFAHANRVWVHYNANYRKTVLLGPLGAEGTPVNQQDNFLARTRAG